MSRNPLPKAFSQARLLFAAVGLFASCKAERMGVEVPRGGESAINQEDLQRDTYRILAWEKNGATRSGGTTAARSVAEDVNFRMREVHLLPVFGSSWQQEIHHAWNVCGLRDGADSHAVLFAARDGGRGADFGATPVAVLMSLAKAEDDRRAPAHSEFFCVVSPDGGEARLGEQPPVPWTAVSDIVVIGPMGGTELTFTDTTFAGQKALLVTTGTDPVHGTDEDTMGRLDFRRIQAHTIELYRRFLAR
jgi:hypothetical protein